MTTGDNALTTPTATTATAPGFSLKARLFRPATRQKLLAFASLIALMVFFSFASPQFLQTVRGVGYRFQAEPED